MQTSSSWLLPCCSSTLSSSCSSSRHVHRLGSQQQGKHQQLVLQLLPVA
jgi:hypothetical protein